MPTFNTTQGSVASLQMLTGHVLHTVGEISLTGHSWHDLGAVQ